MPILQEIKHCGSEVAHCVLIGLKQQSSIISTQIFTFWIERCFEDGCLQKQQVMPLGFRATDSGSAEM